MQFETFRPLLCILFTYNFMLSSVNANSTDYIIPMQTIDDCQKSQTASFHEFYDISKLRCSPCSGNSSEQTVTNDGFSCICQENYRKEDFKDLGSNTFHWKCISCENNTVASLDGYECVQCTTGPIINEVCPECTNADNVAVEVDLNGDWFYSNSSSQLERQCISCAVQTEPLLEERRCLRCNQVLSVDPVVTSCACPADRFAGGLCFSQPTDLVADNQALYDVHFENNIVLDSAFFRENIRAAFGMCANNSQQLSLDYSNLTACQLLGNMCTMLLYSIRYFPPNALNDACSLHLRLTQDFNDDSITPHPPPNYLPPPVYQRPIEWRANMPWLYYPPNDNNFLLSETTISTVYGSGSSLTFKAAKYDLEGNFLGIVDIKNGELQLCRQEARYLDAAFAFATKYHQQCSIPVDSLYDKDEFATYFYDLYLEYDTGLEKNLFAIPVLMRNTAVNNDVNPVNWQLTRRFMLVDRVAGVQANGGIPRVVRFVQSMTFVVKLRGSGQIYPPYVDLLYGQTTSDSYRTGQQVQVSFNVDYRMETSTSVFDLSIAILVMSLLAVVYAFFLTVNWSRRNGEEQITFFTLFKLLLFLCGTLSDAFFVVIFGFSLWYFILYKGQDTVVAVPDTSLDYYVYAYVGSAFALKCLQLAQLIISQVTVDIFMVDWERSRSNAASNQGSTSAGAFSDQQMELIASMQRRQDRRGILEQAKNAPVSAWRTLFVANEWNEIQVSRRIHPVVLLLTVVLILNVVGVENLARFEPGSALATSATGIHRGEYSQLLRFALMVSVYLAVSIVLWLFSVLIKSRFIYNPMRDFIDLCSLCNVSLFVMTHRQFGYYVHGRSPHGFTDVGIAQMHENLKREEENLCGERGLIEGEEHQTFEVAFPSTLRTEYDKILYGLIMSRSPQGSNTREALSNADIETKFHAYNILNKFLQNFLEHNLHNVDYMVTDKNVLEKIFDTELQHGASTKELGFFYYDGGQSFDRTLFYGQEALLQSFDILIFAICDFIFHDFVLDAILTFFLDAVIYGCRKLFGKKNIAKKAMIGEEFLL